MTRRSPYACRILDFDRASCTDLDLSSLNQLMPELVSYDGTRPDELIERSRDAEIILVGQCPLPGSALLGSPRLRLIALAATRYNHIDLATAARLGIAVSNVRDYCTPSLMQHVWSMILSLTQHLHDYREVAIGGAWASGMPVDVRTGAN